MSQDIIHSKEIFPLIKSELTRVKSQIIIVSAYIKIAALKEIDLNLSENIEKLLLVRFRKSDILSNSTDLELYNYCKSNNWKMYFNLELHSKIYVFDKSTYLIGSANATLSGLGLKENSNIESAVIGKCNPTNYNKILEVFDNAHLMTDSIFKECSKQIHDKSQMIFEEWFLNELKISKKIVLRNLWVCDFPVSTDPFSLKQEDLQLLNISDHVQINLNLLQNRFKELKCYNWLLLNIDTEIYFGELTKKLHEALIDSPKPYRKEVKEILAIFLQWINILQINDFIIDRPNYSQRIRKLLK